MSQLSHHRLSDNQIKVWDPLVRIFHWSLVFFFALAWLTEDRLQNLHEWSGYTVAALVGFRIMWGFIGSRHARFRDFVYRPREIKAYLVGLAKARPSHYQGHNPAGGAMVVLLLLSLAALTLSGMALLATEGHGPLATTFLASLPEHDVEEVHEFFANFLLLLVFVHVAGVIVSSLLHRENLVRAMITGRKQAAEASEEKLS